jgi:spermidine synthase
VFAAFRDDWKEAEVAVVGLGTGALACYGEPGQRWTFYEIDPTVERIARDPQFFTYLKDCKAHWDVILGDGRLRLRQAAAHGYRLIVLDAFSSDAIPVHLLTREALHVYLEKLQPDGLLAFHISNRYLDLKPVLANLARDAHVISRFCEDTNVSEAELETGKDPSEWAVIARTPEDLGKLALDSRWHPNPGRAQKGVWTDNFSNVLRLFKWDRP